MRQQKELLTKLTKILTLGFAVSLLSHILSGRGLDLDGAHILYEIIFKQSFIFYETARVTTHFFQQIPAWLFIKFIPINSIEILIQVFSFGLIWIHIISIIGCYLILPKDKKYFLFFPLFAFFTGPLTAFGISISASLSVCSYIWLVAFVIYYSNLSNKWHCILLFLTITPLILSHEKLFYMSWFLIYLIWQKKREFPNKWLYHYLLSFLSICSFFSLVFIFFPVQSEIFNRTQFFRSLFYLEFFFKFDKGRLDSIYYPSLTAFSLLFFLALSFLKQKRLLVYQIVFALILCFAFCSALLPFYNLAPYFKFSAEEEARVFVSCISHPLCILLWQMFEKKKPIINQTFFSICLTASSLLLVYRLGSDYKFYQFQKQFTAVTASSKGIKTWNELSKKEIFKKTADPLLFDLFNFSWKYLSASLLYPRQNTVKTLVLSTDRFKGCYETPQYGMCQNEPPLKNNKFFNFNELIKHEQNKK